jgi:ATP phosphoribosyltransferase
MTINNNNLKLALQKKGRLTEKSLELFENIGLDMEYSKDQLFARCKNFQLDVLFLRNDDIPEYVQDGVCDLGVVGRNIVVEQGAEVEELINLGFGNCRLSIAVPNESPYQMIGDLNKKTIATSYPSTLKKYLNEQNVEADIVQLRGSVEIAPSLDLSDAIADLISTGRTLKRNGLRELDSILDSEALVIQRPNGLRSEKKILIERLMLRIKSSLKARKTKYIVMNALESALPKIRKIVPGLDSPTIVPLDQKGMVAVHTVVEEEIFWDAMEKLKEAGATGILVLPIEKMII